MSARVLVAEDEPLMRERLLGLLGEVWREARVVHAAADGDEAWEAFQTCEPQVVFLDVRMPGMSGLDVAQRIGARAHIIFVTAYDQYAMAAFDAGAVDYLLKPVEADRLRLTVQRVSSRLHAPPADLSHLLRHLATLQPPAERTRWIRASVGKQIRLIDVDEVLFFQSDSKYTRVVLADSEALVRTPLKDLLAGLDPDRFWQIHRSTVVNARAVAAAERIDAERLQLILKGSDERLLVSRAFTHLFKD